MGWVKNLTTSMLAFDIEQFFLPLNHQLFSSILDKASFDPKILFFFWNYLVSRKTKYFWNSFSSLFFNVDIRVGQGSALSLIFSVLYLSLIFHIFKKWLKNLKIPVSTLSFVNNSFFILQNKSIMVLNANIYCSYNIISSLLMKFGLIMEHGKTEVFHFSRLHRVFNLPSLDLMLLRGYFLCPKSIW